MVKYDTILLDVDGTLLDFKRTESFALNKAFENHGILLNKYTLESYKTINHSLWSEHERGILTREQVIYSRFCMLFKELGIDEDGVRFEDEYQELLGSKAYLIDNAIDVVRSLSKTHKLYVVTNGVTKTQYSRLKESGLDKYMKGIFVSEATGYQKPLREFFDYCFERIGNIVLDRTIIVGDSLSSDILGGNNAGISTCWYNPDKELNNIGAKVDIEIANLRELIAILG